MVNLFDHVQLALYIGFNMTYSQIGWQYFKINYRPLNFVEILCFEKVLTLWRHNSWWRNRNTLGNTDFPNCLTGLAIGANKWIKTSYIILNIDLTCELAKNEVILRYVALATTENRFIYDRNFVHCICPHVLCIFS